MTIKPLGFSEVGISTSNLEGWVEFLTQLGGYREIWRGESPEGSKNLWQTPARETVLECLLGNPTDESGYIRLFQFSNIEQEEIRLGSHIWDSGGIYDIDLRVSSLHSIVEELKSRNWKGLSPQPVDWLFGQFLVREWLLEGPDSVTIALMERLTPPLENWDGRPGFSHAFNSSQVVFDMDRAVDFYEKLGFIKLIHHFDPMPGKGGEMLGLPPETAADTPVQLLILQPFGVMEGSVELVRVEGMPGRDLASRGKPYNLGFNLLRFPVSDLRAYAAQIKSLGIIPIGEGIVASRLEPFGNTEFMAVQTPDGVWLEFYQAFA